MRRHLILPFLLAACGDAAERPAAKGDAPPSSPFTAARAGAAVEPQLPDEGDPGAFLSLDTLRWSEWETQRPADAAARLRALGITPIRLDSAEQIEYDPAEMEGYDPNGERVEDFHFVDFSGDGVADVIYSGGWFMRMTDGRFGAGEGTQYKLYQMIGGRAVQVMSGHGDLQRVWKGAPGQPVSLRTVHYGCCSDPEWTLEYLRPARSGDTVRYEPYRRVMGRAEMEMPARFLAQPRRFTVENDPYLLRAEPRIDDAEDNAWPSWPGRGNAVAEYSRGARGTALAERTDSTGRVWWFVRIDGATPPRDAQIIDDPESRVPMDRLGWMSSRFLTPLP